MFCINVPFSRSPLKKQNLESFKIINNLIRLNKYDLIHCQSPIGGAITRLVAKRNNTKVIYTAHGFHFYKGGPKINWLLYYPLEKYLSKYTDTLITINEEDYQIAKTFCAKKVVHLNGVGFDSQKVDMIKRENNSLKESLKISEKQQIILSVGELNKNKNHEIVIEALSKIPKDKYMYIICGDGKLNKQLHKLVRKYGLENNVRFMGFRKDVLEFYNIADIFIFPSFREGLSVSLMEAMSFGLPILASNIRGNIDLIDNGKGGYLFNPSKKNELRSLIKKLLVNEDLKKELGIYNENKITEYSVEKVLKDIEKIYN